MSKKRYRIWVKQEKWWKKDVSYKKLKKRNILQEEKGKIIENWYFKKVITEKKERQKEHERIK